MSSVAARMTRSAVSPLPPPSPVLTESISASSSSRMIFRIRCIEVRRHAPVEDGSSRPQYRAVQVQLQEGPDLIGRLDLRPTGRTGDSPHEIAGFPPHELGGFPPMSTDMRH